MHAEKKGEVVLLFSEVSPDNFPTVVPGKSLSVRLNHSLLEQVSKWLGARGQAHAQVFYEYNTPTTGPTFRVTVDSEREMQNAVIGLHIRQFFIQTMPSTPPLSSQKLQNTSAPTANVLRQRFGDKRSAPKKRNGRGQDHSDDKSDDCSTEESDSDITVDSISKIIDDVRADMKKACASDKDNASVENESNDAEDFLSEMCEDSTSNKCLRIGDVVEILRDTDGKECSILNKGVISGLMCMPCPSESSWKSKAKARATRATVGGTVEQKYPLPDLTTPPETKIPSTLVRVETLKGWVIAHPEHLRVARPISTGEYVAYCPHDHYMYGRVVDSSVDLKQSGKDTYSIRLNDGTLEKKVSSKHLFRVQNESCPNLADFKQFVKGSRVLYARGSADEKSPAFMTWPKDDTWHHNPITVSTGYVLKEVDETGHVSVQTNCGAVDRVHVCALHIQQFEPGNDVFAMCPWGWRRGTILSSRRSCAKDGGHVYKVILNDDPVFMRGRPVYDFDSDDDDDNAHEFLRIATVFHHQIMDATALMQGCRVIVTDKKNQRMHTGIVTDYCALRRVYTITQVDGTTIIAPAHLVRPSL